MILITHRTSLVSAPSGFDITSGDLTFNDTLGIDSNRRFYCGDGTAALPAWTFSADVNTGVFRPGTDTLAFSTGGSERMRIDPSGNLGIGTTSPGAKLQVVGNTTASTGSTMIIGEDIAPVTGAGVIKTTLLIGNTTGKTSIFLGQDATHSLFANWAYNATAGSAVGQIGTYGNTNRLELDGSVLALQTNSGGNVGIRTTSFGTSAAGWLGIATGTAPTTVPADVLQIGSVDVSAGNAVLSWWQEYAPYAGVAVASTTKIPVIVNGTTLYLLATTVQ